MSSKIILTLAIAILSLDAFAGVAFKCQGELSRFEVIQGFYNGEGSDLVDLRHSTVYGISNYGVESDSGHRLNALRLSKVRFGKEIKSGVYSELQLQYSAVRKDSDLGNSKLTFAMPTGVFGAGVGRAFSAVYSEDNRRSQSLSKLHKLTCEIVPSVSFE